jgi:hypothetical protein
MLARTTWRADLTRARLFFREAAMKRGGGKHPSGGRRRREGNYQNPLRDMVVAYVNARRPGPNPLDAYLDLRDPRPSVAKQPGRRQKKQGIWYIVDGDDYISTGCTEKEYETANDVLTLHKNKRMGEPVRAYLCLRARPGGPISRALAYSSVRPR